LSELGRRQLGDRGEALTLKYLEERGYTLVERNRRTLHGEIDLVMRDEETLVLIPKYRAQRPLITIPCSPQ
jgi:putative endonuclease